MQSANSKRFLFRVVKEIATELSIDLKTFSQGRIIELKKNGRVGHIFGYNFGLNNACSHLLLNDKCALTELLIHSGIPSVEHCLFFRPNLSGLVANKGNWSEMLSYFYKNGSDIICKSNTGSGGNDVYRAQTPLELERSVHSLFSSNRTIALSPYINIKSEYRLIMLGNSCELAYEKIRPGVFGDGHSTISELISKTYSNDYSAEKLEAEITLDDTELLRIPNQDEFVTLIWKHNLSKGARAHDIKDEILKDSLLNFALPCIKAFNLNFVAIDIIQTENEFLIMEINSGVMMEFYSRQGDNEYAKAKEIYTKAIMKMLL